MLRRLETEGRPATADEQQVLAAWSGWGAVPQVFDDAHAGTAELRKELRSLLDGDAWDAARRTVLNAHYTDPAVVVAMWDAVARLGLIGGRVLEPGCGSGNFLAHAPPGAELVGIERDPTTVAIARALYPDAEIHAGPFERFVPADPFDLVIGNVPFAEPRAFEPTCARWRRSFTGPGCGRAEPALEPIPARFALRERQGSVLLRPRGVGVGEGVVVERDGGCHDAVAVASDPVAASAWDLGDEPVAAGFDDETGDRARSSGLSGLKRA